jgi:hypothetical protein
MTDPVPDPWPDDEPTSIDVHLDRLEQLHQRIGELMANDSTEADRIAEERMREANRELLRKLAEEVEASKKRG